MTKLLFASLKGFCFTASVQDVIGFNNIEALMKCQLLEFNVNQLCECIYLLGYTLGVSDTLKGNISENSEYWKLQKAVLNLIQELRKEARNRVQP